ncbi:MAG: ThuA domain-containing protein [Candidatus Micrarchaeota archaeon]|mgnify:FL=1
MYGGPIAGKTTHLESSIPLILIIILAVFIAGNFGLVNFGDVPVLGSIFGGKSIKVTVIGKPTPGLINHLTSKDARDGQIWYAGNGLRQELLTEGNLKQFDVVILQGQPVCDRNARKIITNWVKGGGKLIVIGDACTRVDGDPAAFGWDIGGLLGEVIPAKIGGVTSEKEPIKYGCSSGTYRIIEFGHPITAGIKDYQFSGRTIEVYPTSNSKVLTAVDCSDTSRGNMPTTYGILESSGLFSGKTVYFSYDPGATSAQLFLNTLKYMKNQKG